MTAAAAVLDCSVPAARGSRGGHLSVPLAACAQAATLTPVQFRIWVGLALACRAGRCTLPRSWVLDRAGLPVTRDTLKKLSGHLRAIEAAGLLGIEVDGELVHVQVVLTLADRADGWHCLITRELFDRALDPEDPLTGAAVQAFACRWLPILRRERVQVSQAEMATRWGVDRATVRRESAALAALGLLTVRRAGGSSIVSDGRLDLVETAPVRQIGQSDKSGTGKATHPAPQPTEALFTARASLSRHEEPLDAFSGSARSADQDPDVRENRQAGADGPGTGKPKSTSPKTRTHEAEAWRLVRSVRWLATAPTRARHQAARMLARRLRLGGPAGRPGVWTPEAVARALRSADPGSATDQHARIIRAALAGLVADARVRSRPECGPADRPTAIVDQRETEAELDPARIAELVSASLDSVRPASAPVAGSAARRASAEQLRSHYLELAQAGPPDNPAEVVGFLTGVLLGHVERTGRTVSVVAAQLGHKIEPRYVDALAVAAGEATTIAVGLTADGKAA